MTLDICKTKHYNTTTHDISFIVCRVYSIMISLRHHRSYRQRIKKIFSSNVITGKEKIKMLLVFGKEFVTEIEIENGIGHELRKQKLGELLIAIIQKFEPFFSSSSPENVYNLAFQSNSASLSMAEIDSNIKNKFIHALESLPDADRLTIKGEFEGCLEKWWKKLYIIYNDLDHRTMLTSAFLNQPLSQKIKQSYFLNPELDVDKENYYANLSDIERGLEEELDTHLKSYPVQLCSFDEKLVCAFDVHNLDERISLEYWFSICNHNTLQERVCPVCGKLFKANNKRKNFCSDKCKSANQMRLLNTRSPYYRPYRLGYQYNNNVLLNYSGQHADKAKELYDKYRKKTLQLYQTQEQLYWMQQNASYTEQFVDDAFSPCKARQKAPSPMSLEKYKNEINKLWKEFRNELKKL